MGLGFPKCGGCLPDAISFATGSDRLEEALTGSEGRAKYDAVGQLSDEHTLPARDSDMIIFREDQAPCGPSPVRPPVPDASSNRLPAPSAVQRNDMPGPPCFEYGADSASMLNDLDFLTSPEWQTMPPSSTSVLDDKLLAEATAAAPGTSAYPVALRALWHNSPDALEVALKRLDMSALTEAQARDAEFMQQKLEFTRIRQEFVALCVKFRGPDGSAIVLQKGVARTEERCSKLMAAQPDEQCSQLPGLVQKRDTIMLLSRIRAIYARLQELQPLTPPS